MSSSDFFRKFQPLFESAMSTKAADAADDRVTKAKETKAKKKEEEKKPKNVKENAADFFRKYSDIIKEAEEKEEVKEEVKDDEEDEKDEVKESDDPFDKNYKDPGDKESSTKKVAGKAYGGSKQDDGEKEPWYAKKDPDTKKDKKAAKK
jgi:hypothetical protein